MATGIDRVEFAYLTHLLREPVPLWGLMRTPVGYLLLDTDGLRAFAQRLSGEVAWGQADWVSRLARGRSDALRRAEADARRLSVARCPPSALRFMLRRRLPAGFGYLNTGHSNLTTRVMATMHALAARVTVFVHDVIPLEHPDWQKEGSAHTFREQIARVSQYADLIIYPSRDAQIRAEAYLGQMGRVPDAVVAFEGVELPSPDPQTLPDGLPPTGPYFMTVGTIEPRKNIGFLLDVWEELGPQAPRLLICGSRGWRNEDVFSRLDALPPESSISEHQNISDAGLSALMSGAAGLVFPSLAEGYGRPPIEAAAMNIPVICSDLAVYREFLGIIPVYVSPSNRYLWTQAIQQTLSTQQKSSRNQAFVTPTWAAHFKTVLRLT